MKRQALLLSLAAGLILAAPAHCLAQPDPAPPARDGGNDSGERRLRIRERFRELQQKEKDGTLSGQEKQQLERIKQAIADNGPRPESRDRRPPPSQDFRPGERPNRERVFAGQPGRMPMFDRLLTEEQRASLREAMESQRDEMRALEEKLHEARREAQEASLAKKFNENAVRKKSQAVGKIEAELAVLRAKAFSKIKPALSDEQINRLKNPPPFGDGERPEFRRDDRFRDGPPPRGPRDEHDLPPKPRPE